MSNIIWLHISGPSLDSNRPPLSLNELCDAVSDCTNKWKNIALQLKLSLIDIERIQIECNNNIEECFIRVFNKWERQRKVPYTWDTIVKVLDSRSVGEMTIAAEIRQKYN